MSQSTQSCVTAKDNPFATHRVEAVSFRFAEGTWDSQLARLRSMNWRGAIVGNHGSGKTTLMLELKSKLDREMVSGSDPCYCFLSRDSGEHAGELDRLLQAASRGSVLLVDGIERLRWFQRRRLLRHDPGRTGLVVTTHGPIGLPVWVDCRTDWLLMQSVLEELVESCGEPLVQETRGLFEKHRGNIRDVLRGLYDLWSTSASTFTG